MMVLILLFGLTMFVMSGGPQKAISSFNLVKIWAVEGATRTADQASCSR